MDLISKAKEAELNARVLSLESQIHWLKEQNSQLQEQGARTMPGASASSFSVQEELAEKESIKARCSELESELRKAKRAEQKLQALLFR